MLALFPEKMIVYVLRLKFFGAYAYVSLPLASWIALYIRAWSMARCLFSWKSLFLTRVTYVIMAVTKSMASTASMANQSVFSAMPFLFIV